MRFAPGHGARGLGKGGHWEEEVEGWTAHWRRRVRVASGLGRGSLEMMIETLLEELQRGQRRRRT